MRLLILTPEFSGFGGGIMTFYSSLAPALVRAGIKVRVIEGSATNATEDRTMRLAVGVAVETLEHDRLMRWFARLPDYAAVPSFRRHLAAAWAMWEQADRGEDADLVVAVDWGLLFVPPSIEQKRPLIAQCHGSVGQISVHDPVEGEGIASLAARLIERDTISRAQAIHTHSHANAAFWRAESGKNVAMIRPAWQHNSTTITEELSARGTVIGRVQRWKGPDVLCVALRLLGSRAPGMDWHGRDTAWGARQQSSSAHLSKAFPDVWNKVVLHRAQVLPIEVARLQTSALFNLVPSTWDVFNWTTVEAMASGRPTIVSTGAGASELIEDGVNGFTFPSGDAEALAAAIDRLLSSSPSRLAEMGRAAQATIRTELDPDRIASQRIAAYRVAIDDFNANPPAPIGGWLGDICRPSEGKVADEMAFLEHQPLRALAGHVVGRIARKVRAR